MATYSHQHPISSTGLIPGVGVRRSPWCSPKDQSTSSTDGFSSLLPGGRAASSPSAGGEESPGKLLPTPQMGKSDIGE